MTKLLPTALAFATLAVSAFTFGVSTLSAAAGETRCVRTEQRGCLEFDMLNFQYDPTHSLMQKIPASGRFTNPSAYISTKWGPDLYKSYKRGELEAGGAQSFCICIYNPGARIETSRMSAYVLHNRKHKLTRHSVKAVNAGQSCPTAPGLGRADAAFRISIGAGTPGAAFQLPWDMIGKDTYIMTGPVGSAIYPRHGIGSGDGFWHTPQALASAKRKGWSYWIRPVVQN